MHYGTSNEANSDIHGAMVEFFANNSSDKGDYRIGEKIVKINPHFLRRMDNPRLDAPLYNDGSHSYNCWSPIIGDDDVHFSSGPANHWFYLLAEGSGPKTINGMRHNSPTCNGSNVSGIGRTPAARIWYRAVDIDMTSTSQYSNARDATIRAARDLFGVGSTRCQQVVRSWNAVSVAPNNWSCSAPVRKGPGSHRPIGGGYVGRLARGKGNNAPSPSSYAMATSSAGGPCLFFFI